MMKSDDLRSAAGDAAQEPAVRSARSLLARSRSLPWLLYGSLALAAAVGLAGQAGGVQMPGWARAAAPIAFGVFLLLFASYRYLLVRAGRFRAGKAFLQVGAGALFLTMLLPHAGPGQSAPRSLEALLTDDDPAVRALACEVVPHRPEGRRLALLLVERLSDTSQEVRAQARQSLLALAGSDIGGNGPDAAERWRRWAAP